MYTTASPLDVLVRSGLVLTALMLCAPASAQDIKPLNFDSNFTVRVLKNGAIITPSSSNPQVSAGGVRAHTNVHIFQHNSMPTTKAVRANSGPPVAGYFYETPASLACVYNLAAQISGCNPNVVSTVPIGGSRAIAIVDAYHAPNALADLTAFSRQFGLPLPTASTFQVVYSQSNGTPTTRAPAYDSGWEVEISLDIQWAHAMAPNAKIILVEAASSSLADLLGAERLAGQLVAAAGGGQVTNSWGANEFPQETSFDNYFAINGVVYFASTGDNPGTEWPSVSQNVVAVGGTSVSRNPVTGVFEGEAAWDNGGGGQSLYVARPAYQSPVASVIGGTMRGVPDVAAIANPNTGVWVYDFNAGGWIVVGGTSVASPVVAGITNNAGHFSVSTVAELTRLYTQTNRFFDVTRGVCGPYAGYFAQSGWDFCTGIGSPAVKGEM
ncbi:MAG TPA: S53 family peptidase [Xanthobacteraceae bacterium]|nr:S53 family peptidase [Xanthobacteraceae bacterium]